MCKIPNLNLHLTHNRPELGSACRGTDVDCVAGKDIYSVRQKIAQNLVLACPAFADRIVQERESSIGAIYRGPRRRKDNFADPSDDAIVVAALCRADAG